MRMKASAYKQYGDAAILSLVLEALPQIAAEVSIKPSLKKPMVSIPGVCSPCQDRPDCADWRRQQHHTCENYDFNYWKLICTCFSGG